MSPFKPAELAHRRRAAARCYDAIRDRPRRRGRAVPRAGGQRAQGREEVAPRGARPHRAALPGLRRHRARGVVRRLQPAVLPDLPDRRQAAGRPPDVPPAEVTRRPAGVIEPGPGRAPSGRARAATGRVGKPGQVRRPRAVSTTPSEARCGVRHCTSRSRGRRTRRAGSPTSPTSATLDASVSRWNIDSPANSPPIATPYRPPTSRRRARPRPSAPSPSSCRRRYAAAIGLVDPAARRGRGSAQPSTTSRERGVHPDLEAPHGPAQRPGDRAARPAAAPRGRTGQNQHGGSPGAPDGIGNSPRRYAASRVPGSRSAPMATRSSSRVEPRQESGNDPR